eukprot:11789211-Ditylum_brightwellii.AAC.1
MGIKLNPTMRPTADLIPPIFNLCAGRHNNNSLTVSTRTSLLHTKCKWLSIITSALWPFCCKAAEERHNKLDIDADG